jgi:hypothetical protein
MAPQVYGLQGDIPDFPSPFAASKKFTTACFAAEITLDYSAAQGREIVPIRQGDDIGYPCCASKISRYMDVIPVPNCSKIAGESGLVHHRGTRPLASSSAVSSAPGPPVHGQRLPAAPRRVQLVEGLARPHGGHCHRSA